MSAHTPRGFVMGWVSTLSTAVLPVPRWLPTRAPLLLAEALPVALLLALLGAPTFGQARSSVGTEVRALDRRAPLTDADGFVQAGPGRPLSLPADHASHPETRTEWWYFTGPLRDETGAHYGFQATWFRRALVANPGPRRSSLAVRDVILFHGALSSLSAGTMLSSENSSRANPPWGGAATDRLAVWALEDAARAEGDRLELEFAAGAAHLALQLDLASSPVLRHGAEPGLSVKGHAPGQASWYYSLPAIQVSGQLRPPDGSARHVTGRAWMDHEFGAGALDVQQVGWDWFSVVLDDDTVLMAYTLRRRDGTADDTSSASLLLPGSAAPMHLGVHDFRVQATGTWRSPTTGIDYPSGWTLLIPDKQIVLSVTPLLADQELRTATTGVTYWEGLCRWQGTRAGTPVSGEGYVELVGYGESISERFSPSGR